MERVREEVDQLRGMSEKRGGSAEKEMKEVERWRAHGRERR